MSSGTRDHNMEDHKVGVARSEITTKHTKKLLAFFKGTVKVTILLE